MRFRRYPYNDKRPCELREVLIGGFDEGGKVFG